jgi:hypothetical protein
MGRRLTLWGIWLGFISYLLFFAPPVQPDTFQPLQSLVSGQLPQVNPVTIALFSMIGIWILIYSCLVFADGRMQKLPAWAFILGSAVAGVIALIPYLALREPNQQFAGQKDSWLALLDSHKTGIILAVSTFIFLGYGLFFGDWSAFWYEFQTNRFMHGMTLAFGLFTLLFPFPTLLRDDMGRRGLNPDSQLFKITAFIPLFGALFYLCVRPPLWVNR